MYKKSAYLMTVILAAAVTASGCGSSSNTDGAKPTSSGSPAASQSASQSSEPAGEKQVTLKVLSFKSGQEIGNMEQLNEKFEQENPGIQIELEAKGGTAYKELLKARAASGELADVVMVHPGYSSLGPYAEADYLLDLSGEPWAGDIADSAKSVTSFEGKLYALPNDLAALGVYYNKEVFEKLGLAVPTTYDEFLEICEKIKASGMNAIALNKDWQIFDTYTFAPSWIYANHPDFDDKMNAGEGTFAGVWEEMFQAYEDLYKNYAPKDAQGLSGDAAQNNFANGKAAMMINGSWAYPSLKQANPDLQFGMFPLPNREGAIWAAAAVGTTWAINKDSAQIEAAKTYLKFWADPANQASWAQSQNSFPTNMQAKQDVEEGLKPIADAIAQGNYWRFLDQGWINPNLQPEFQTNTQKLLYGQLTVEGVTQALDAEMKKYVEQNR